MVTLWDGVEGKVCSSCREWKPLGEFYADRTHGRSQGGRHCRCKKCHSIKGKRKRALYRRLLTRARGHVEVI